MWQILPAARLLLLSSAILASVGCSPKILSGTIDPGHPGASSSGVSHSTMVANPAVLLADGSTNSKITINLKDENGNPVSGKSILLFSNRGLLDIIPSPSGVSDANGNVSFSVLSTHAGASVLSATDSTDHLSISSSANLTFLPGNVIASQTTLAASQATVIADGVASTLITVTLKDAQGNPVSGKSVSLSSSRGMDVILPAIGVTGSNGSFSFTAHSTSSGVSVFTATDVSDSLTFSEIVQVIFLSGSGNSIQSTVISSPTSVVANGTSTSTITVTLKDAQGNPVPGKTISLSSSRGGSDLISSGTNPSNSLGSVTFTVQSSTTGTSTFTATDITDSTTLAQTPLVTFIAGPVSPTRSTLSTNLSSVTDDGSSTAILTVTLKDGNGNPVSGKTVTLSSSRNGSDVISAASGASSSRGQVTFTVKSTQAGSSTYTASDTTDSISVSQTAVVTFTTGPVTSANSTLVASQTNIAADGNTTSTLTVTLEDSTGNPVPGKIVTLSSSRGGSDTISAASGASNASGVVTFTVKSTSSGSSTFTAIDTTDSTTVNQTASVTFVATSVSPSQSTVVSSPSSVTADGNTPSTITVTLKDGSGNPISGKTVTLSSSRGATDTISNASGLSSASGIVTFTVQSSTTGTGVFTAQDSTDFLTITQTASVLFSAGAVSASSSTVNVSPAQVSADGVSTSTITVTLLDSASHPVPNKSVSVSSSRGTNDTFNPSSGTSDSNGQTIFTVSSSSVGTAVISAQDTSDSVNVIQTGSVHFYGNLASNTRFAAIPESIPADGSTTTTIYVTLLDSTETPIFGKAISLTSSRGSLDSIQPSTVITDSNGNASFTLSSPKIGFPALQATDTTDNVVISKTVRVALEGSSLSPQTEYRPSTALNGFAPGNNSFPTISWKNASSSSATNDATLHGFAFTPSDGWSGDGTLFTGGTAGPFRLVFNGTSDYLDAGPSINTNSSYSFETWMRPQSATSSTLLSNADGSNRGFNLSELSDGSGRISLTTAQTTYSSYSQAVLSDSPTLYWKLDETSGSSVSDSSGNGNLGTYYTANTAISLALPSLAFGSKSGALLPGSQASSSSTIYSNSYVPYSSNASYSNEIWIQTTTPQGGKISGMETSQTGEGNYDRWLYMSNDGSLNFVIWTGAVNTISTSGISYNDGKPHHIVNTFSVANGPKLYVDGVLVASNSSFTSSQGNNNYYFRLGGGNLGGVPNPNLPSSYYLNAEFDEAAVYSTELSAARVLAHYLAGTQGCITQAPLSLNVWSHLAGVFNSVDNSASLYLNGNRQCLFSFSGSQFSGSGNHFTVGATAFASNFWSGALGSIKTYAQALTNSMIQSDYAASAVQFDVQQLGAQAPVLWLKADSLQGLSDGASISTWPDSSANGNNVTQTTPGSQPVWKKNILNGYPVVRFNGSTSFMDGPAVFPTNSDYSIVVVFKVNNLIQNNTILGGSASQGHMYFLQQNANLTLFHAGNNPSQYSSTPVTTTQYFVASVTYQIGSQAVQYFLNGSSAGTATQTAPVTDSNLEIGSWGGYAGSQGFAGDIAEIFLFHSDLSNNDRSLIEIYLNAKYGIY